MAETANEVPQLKAALQDIAKNYKIEHWFDFGPEEEEINSQNDQLDQAFVEE